MKRFFVQLSYNGTHYHGWQIQPNDKSIQEELEKAIYTITRENSKVVGAGRTDTGVHASFYVAHFDSNTQIKEDQLTYKLNKLLPSDICIQSIYIVDSESHARFSAIYREYKYIISKSKDPFFDKISYHYIYPLDIEKMNEALNILYDIDDFASFAKTGSDNKTSICKIHKAHWEESDQYIVLTIRADRFLRNMVRSIVGTTLDVGRNKISLSDFKTIVQSKNRSKAGTSVPGHALFLVDVGYPKEMSKGLIRKEHGLKF